ncbi:WG repeat-containing protein [Lachnospiraceae bacterium 45-W7]
MRGRKINVIGKCAMAAVVVALSLCAGCSTKENKPYDEKGETVTEIEQRSDDIAESETTETYTDEMPDKENGLNMDTEDDEQLGMEADSDSVVIRTRYIPVAYRKNALIVQRSEEVELYGLLDDQGNVLLEPEYERLTFVFMNGQEYIRASLGEDTGLLNLKGEECIEMGKYDDIATAGDIGWLAFKEADQSGNAEDGYTGREGGEQFLLDENGDVLKAFRGIYDCCFGTGYLFRSKTGMGFMSDSQGGDTCELNLVAGDVYDLSENLLISSDEKDIIMFQWLVAGDKLGVTILGKGVYLIDMNGNIISELGDVNANIVEPIAEEQKIILVHSMESVNLFEFDLASNTVAETEFIHDSAWNAQIIVKESGDLYQIYKNEKPLFEERFVDYSFNDGVLWLENIDSEWGIVDYDGNVVIPFGETDSRDSLLEDDNLKFLTSEGMFGLCTQYGEDYEFCNFVIAKGRSLQVD